LAPGVRATGSLDMTFSLRRFVLFCEMLVDVARTRQ